MAAAAAASPALLLLALAGALATGAAFGPLPGDAAPGGDAAGSFGMGPRWRFNVSAGAALQETFFGAAPAKGWLGGDHVSSFHLSGQRYLWVFGDSLTNLSTSGAQQEGDAMSTCNYFPARTCAMPTNSFAMYEAPEVLESDSPAAAVVTQPAPAGLEFHMSFDKRSGQATSTVWPPGWGGSGHSPRTPHCKGCSLWQAPTTLLRSGSQCKADGAEGALKDKGGCCSTMERCTGYCCHREFYFKATAGIASLDGRRVLLLSQMGKESSVMPEHGKTYATYAVSVSNAGSVASPRDWIYKSDRMPDTLVWPWSTMNETRQFYTAITRARVQAQPDLVYVLGTMGKSRVLARANLTNLLEFQWERMEFWAEGLKWKPYKDGIMPRLSPLWEFRPSEASLHWDDHLGGWLVPEVDRETRVVIFRVASEITGPYKTHLVGTLPANVLGSNLSQWDVQAVKSHPELSSSRCQWVLSMVFYWKSKATPPPGPGLHYFPRILCVAGSGETTTTSTTPPTTSTSTSTTTRAPTPPPVLETPLTEAEVDDIPEPEPAETSPEESTNCSPDFLREIEDNMACSDMGDGCHTCRKRAEWIVKHNGDPIEKAYSIVAADFPQGCGAVLRCKSELAQLASIREAWDARGKLADAIAHASNSAAGGSRHSAALAVVLGGCCLAALALPLSLGLAAVRRSRSVRSQDAMLHDVVVGDEANASEGALLAVGSPGGALARAVAAVAVASSCPDGL